jgi:hypothetical protein
MRIWFKEWKDNHMIRDKVVSVDGDDTRTHKIFKAIDEVCMEFDLSHPTWLDMTIKDFKAHAKARFTKDCFVEDVEFDFLEIHVLDEDY